MQVISSEWEDYYYCEGKEQCFLNESYSRRSVWLSYFFQKFKMTLFWSCEPTQHENSNVYEENTNLWKIPICEAELQSHCTLLFPKSPLLSSLTYSFALIQSWKQRRSWLWEGSLQNAKVSYLQMDINMANKGYQIIFGATEKLPEINLLRCLFDLFCRSEYAHI